MVIRSGSKAAKKPSTPTYVENAPLELIGLYEKGGNGRVELGRLLQDPRMVGPWRRIEERRQRNPNAGQWRYANLWGAILTALSRANRAEGRRKAGKLTLHAEKKDHALKASKIAEQLAKHLETDGQLDFLAHTLFPGDVERLGPMALRDRELNKAGVSLMNTTFLELLSEFQRRTRDSAQTKPLVPRVRARNEAKKDARPNTFLLVLHEVFFEHRFEGPMHAALATITNVTLDLPEHRELTGDFVGKALARKSGDKGRE